MPVPALTPEGRFSVNVKARMTIQGAMNLTWMRVQVIVIVLVFVLLCFNDGLAPLAAVLTR